MKKLTALLILLLCMVMFGGFSAFAEAETSEIVLRGWNEEDGYQYIQLGYYPFYSDGTYAPITWRILNINENVALLQSVYALDAYDGNKYTHPTEIYAGFFNAFKYTTQFERLVTLSDTVLSVPDLSNTSFGFDADTTNSRTRSVMATPYAAKKGLPTENEYVSYWTYEGDSVKKITPAGSVLPVSFTSTLAVVPSITISTKALELDKGTGTLSDPYASSKSEIALWLKENMFFSLEDSEPVSLHNYNRNTIKTYTGPGTRYYRTPNSQITSRTASVRVLAREGRWYMIEYKTGGANSKKLLKTAWIHESDLQVSTKDRYTVEAAAYLPEFNLSGYISEPTDLYDDVDMVRDPLYTLWENQQISFLGYTLINGYSMAYIETEIYNKPVRGFVPLSNIELESYNIDQLTNMIGK